MKSVAVFCSSYKDIDPKYNEAARKVIKGLCEKSYTVVSGGTVKGTMGVISDEVVKCGGKHIGILPKFMKGLEYPNMTKTIWTDTMAERKELMREYGSDATIALPGGVGTLDELIETLTLAKLDRYHGKILVLNCDGFYNPLKDMLDYLVDTSMFDSPSRAKIKFLDSAEDLLKLV